MSVQIHVVGYFLMGVALEEGDYEIQAWLSVFLVVTKWLVHRSNVMATLVYVHVSVSFVSQVCHQNVVCHPRKNGGEPQKNNKIPGVDLSVSKIQYNIFSMYYELL